MVTALTNPYILCKVNLSRLVLLLNLKSYRFPLRDTLPSTPLAFKNDGEELANGKIMKCCLYISLSLSFYSKWRNVMYANLAKRKQVYPSRFITCISHWARGIRLACTLRKIHDFFVSKTLRLTQVKNKHVICPWVCTCGSSLSSVSSFSCCWSLIAATCSRW